MMRYSSRRPSSRRGNFSPRGRGGYSGGSRGIPFGFDHSQLIQTATPVEETVYQSQRTFADFGFPAALQRNVDARGYNQPTQIQDEAIPVLMEGKDVIGLARTGTGKTAAFLLPLIAKLVENPNQHVLIIAPTRELAVQIDQEFRLFSQGLGLYSVVCIGGVNIRPQIDKLRRRPHFVIGTPGRLRDLEGQRVLSFSVFNTIVLDEVDQMLDMGFVKEIREIVAQLGQPRHSLFFSATMPAAAEQIARQLLNNPVRINVKAVDTTQTINQDIVKANGRPKMQVLHEVLQQPEVVKAIVFVKTKRGAEKLSQILTAKGVANAAIHGNKSQGQRQRAIDAFKRERVPVLIATDVASRGLDIDDVSHVINFDLPDTYEDYTHRIGRTGRANKQGMALSIVD